VDGRRASLLRRLGVEALEDRCVPSATYSSLVLASAPVAYWRLGDSAGPTAIDSSGNGNNGTYVGGAGAFTFSQPGAIVNDATTAVRFNNVANSGITLPAMPFNFPALTQGSFEVWFRVNPGASGTILGQIGGVNIPPGGASAGHSPCITIDSTGVVRGQFLYHGSIVSRQSAPGFNDGQYHHLVITYNAGTETLYLDGVSVASLGGLVQSVYNGAPPTNYSYYLGAGQAAGWPGVGNPGGWWYLNGTLDEAALYQTSLSAATVLQHFQVGRANDVAFSTGGYTVAETAGTALITITRAGDLTHTDTVLFSTSNGSAVAGVDYGAVTNLAVNFAIGQATATVAVPIINRPGPQPNRTVNLTLTSPTGVPVIFPTANAVLTIVDAETTVSLTSSVNPSLPGEVVTFTATVTGGGATPTGTVTFFDGATPLATVGLNAAGQGIFSISTLALGSHNITAQYNGDPNYTPNVSPILVQVVRRIDLFATGAGEGGGPQVNVYDARTNGLLYSFFAYGPGFTGGVRVAVGDVSGDGIDDIITGAGPGGLPQINVYDGRTGNLIRAFFAFDVASAGPTGTPSAFGGAGPNVFFTGGVYVAAGDVNGDGFAEIIVGADKGGGPQVEVYDGLTGVRTSSFYAFVPFFTGGVRVATADIDGDGRDEIVAGAGAGGGPQVVVMTATGGTLASFFATAPNFLGGVFVSGGDTNGDGVDEVITGVGAGGGPQVTIFTGTGTVLNAFFAFTPATGSFTPGVPGPPTLGPTFSGGVSQPTGSPFSTGFTGGVRVATTDTNGDGRVEILAGAGPGGGPQVVLYDALTLGTVGSFFAFDPGFTGGVFVG